jgi:hypothetical protein
MRERSHLISLGSNDLASFVSKVRSRVESGQDNPNIVFTFTFEYENEIEFGKVRNENKNELAGYR